MPMDMTLDDGIAVVKMDDGKANALSTDVFIALNGVLDRVEAASPAAVVITGREGIFCAGLNLKWIPTITAAERAELMVHFQNTMERIYHFPIPTIAALSGHAIAGGCIMACACDKRVALSGPYKLQMNEVFISMAAPDWAQRIVRSVIPVPYIDDIMLYGEPVGMETALARHFVHETVGTFDALLPKAMEFAAAAKALVPDSYRRTKQMHRAIADGA